jgi:hypothetical protein
MRPASTLMPRSLRITANSRAACAPDEELPRDARWIGVLDEVSTASER